MGKLILFLLACWIFPPLGAVVTTIAAILFLILKLIAVAAVGTVVAAAVIVSYNTVKSWIDENSVRGDVAEIIRRSIGDAEIVQTNIFGPNNNLRHTNTWRGDALDEEMKAKLAGREKVVISI